MRQAPRRLPALGPRGEGWVIGQLVFIIVIAVAPAGDWPAAVASAARPLGALLLAAGLVVAARGVLDLGANVSPFPRPRPGGSLVERGIYRHVRHPIYAGLVLLGLGWSLWRASSGGVLLSAAFALYLDLKSRREEDFLADAFPAYGTYRRRTARFVPRLY